MALVAFAIICLVALVTPSFSQSAAALVPENAHAKSYGDGWECDIFFRADSDQCVAVVAPQNAYLTNQTYGAGWECLHGFENVEGASCIKVFVPAGGYLDQSGDRWHCLRGYRKDGDTCEYIALPDHSYLSDDAYGSDWVCERGYEKNSDDCTAILVPENAFLNSSSYGQPWTCERGYFEADGYCTAVVIPANAFFADATYGRGWKCERGFSLSDDTCVAIIIPANAHLDRSGNRWECNQNFQRSKGLCRLRD